MYSFFQFLYRNRAFLTFIFLEVASFWLIVSDRSYLGAKFFNSSNRAAATVLRTTSNVSDYFSLNEVNLQLAEENVRLQQALLNRPPFGIAPFRQDTASKDSAKLVFKMLAARVINNSTQRVNNYLTIDKGEKDGVSPGMGVVGPMGIVGKVKYTSDSYASVISLLHTEFLISSSIKRNNVFGTIRWGGTDPTKAQLEYIPRHIALQVGDTIVTSGFNSIFPQGYDVGVIEDFSLSEDATFYTINVKLSTDFYSLSYVYVVKNMLGAEKDSLELLTVPSYD